MPAALTRSSAPAFLAGVALICVLALAGYVAVTATGGVPLAPDTPVRAVFDDAGQLRVGDEVRANSSLVGRVSAIERVGDGALVVMELRGDHDIYADARAALWDVSVLGQKFVELDPGTPDAGPLPDGVIPRERTAPATDLGQLFAVFDPPTREAAGSALRELGGGLAGHSRDLHDVLTVAPDLLADAQAVAGSLAAPQADLPALLVRAELLSAQLAERRAELENLLLRSTETLDALAVDDAEPLSDALAALPDTLAGIRAAHDALQGPLRDLRDGMTALGPGAHSLGAAVPDARGLLREGVDPLRAVPDVARATTPAIRELSAALGDLRPLVPRLNRALASLHPFLTALAPYSVDIPRLAENAAAVVGARELDENGLVLGHVRILPVLAEGSLAGLVQEGYDPYPQPGTATRDGSRAPHRGPGGGP